MFIMMSRVSCFLIMCHVLGCFNVETVAVVILSLTHKIPERVPRGAAATPYI